MKKIILLPLVCTLLLTACNDKTKVNEDENPIKDTIENLTSEEKDILDGLTNGEGNLSYTGNDLDVSDKEKDYSLRLRIIAIHSTYLEMINYLIPKPYENDNYVIQEYITQIEAYQTQGKIYKDLLNDLEYYDPKFNTDELFLHENLATVIDAFDIFYTNTKDMFSYTEDKKGKKTFFFNQKDYSFKEYEKEYKSLINSLNQTIDKYSYYGFTFLSKNKSLTKEEIQEFLALQSHYFNIDSFVLQEINYLLYRNDLKEDEKDKHWNYLKESLVEMSKSTPDKKLLSNKGIELVELINSISKVSTYKGNEEKLKKIESLIKEMDLIKEFSEDDKYYANGFVDYYNSYRKM